MDKIVRSTVGIGTVVYVKLIDLVIVRLVASAVVVVLEPLINGMIPVHCRQEVEDVNYESKIRKKQGER